MAWIESHQALGQHPKTIAFAEQLHVSLPTAVGHLQYLWWWALDFAPSGQIRTTPAVIAHACLWRGSAQKFWQSLILAGFIDVDEDVVTIHDWMDYGGKLTVQRELRRESNRQAQSARRQRLRQHVSTAESAQSQQPRGHNSTGEDTTVPSPLPSPDVSADALQNGAAAPSPRAAGTNPRAMGSNPRALGTNPRARRAEPVLARSVCCPNFARTGEHWEHCPEASQASP
jgi:hypothetical protein